ncbi:MAG: DUF6922 domain-containing protein [Cyclobacteriaceae bacterium]
MPNFPTSKTTKPRLSSSAFWDVDLEKLDVDRYADFTIIRIFERGTSEDIQETLNYYGKTRVVDSLLAASSLMPRAMSLGIKMFGLSPNQFACSKPSPRAMNYSMY